MCVYDLPFLSVAVSVEEPASEVVCAEPQKVTRQFEVLLCCVCLDDRLVAMALVHQLLVMRKGTDFKVGIALLIQHWVGICDHNCEQDSILSELRSTLSSNVDWRG